MEEGIGTKPWQNGKLSRRSPSTRDLPKSDSVFTGPMATRFTSRPNPSSSDPTFGQPPGHAWNARKDNPKSKTRPWRDGSESSFASTNSSPYKKRPRHSTSPDEAPFPQPRPLVPRPRWIATHYQKGRVVRWRPQVIISPVLYDVVPDWEATTCNVIVEKVNIQSLEFLPITLTKEFSVISLKDFKVKALTICARCNKFLKDACRQNNY